jgi:uncharacterized BrkB/YihY/UPF0761 family membrane protein
MGVPPASGSAVWQIAKETIDESVSDDAMTLAASLAYYTALAMSPLVVLLLWIATFAGESMQRQLVAQGGEAIRAIVDNADATPGLGTFAGLVSLATLLFSVSGVSESCRPR